MLPITGEEARKHLTDPAQAEQFVAETGVDALAAAIGTSHGAYKFKHKPTGNRLAMTGAIRRAFQSDPSEFDPRAYLGPAREAMKKVCIDRMVAFGQAGNASKIKVKTCAEMVAFYTTKE
jgi:fructose-bisphosphate aldolase class II